MKGDQHRYLLGRSAATLLLRVAAVGLGFATTLVAAKALAPDAFGAFTWTIAFATLLQFLAVLGLDRIVVRDAAGLRAQGDHGRLRGLARRTTQIALGVSLALVAISAIAVYVVPKSDLPASRGTIWLGLLMLPPLALTPLRQGFLQAFDRIVWSQIPDLVIRPVVFLGIFGTLAIVEGERVSARAAVAAYVFAVAGGFVLLSVSARRVLSAAVGTAAPTYSTRAWLAATPPLLLLSVWQLATTQLLVFTVGLANGSSDAALFSIASRTAALAGLVLLAANIALAPTLSRLFTISDLDALQHAITAAARGVLVGTAAVCAGLAVFAGSILHWVGAEYVDASAALRILLLAQLVNAAGGPNSLVLVMTGHERDVAGPMLLGTLTVAALGLAGSRWGVVGAAFAALGATLLVNAVLVVRVRRRLGVDTTFAALVPAHGPSTVGTR